MKFTLIALFTIVALLAAMLIPSILRDGARKTGLQLRAAASLFCAGLRRQFSTANANPGLANIVKESITKLTSAATARYLLMCKGADNDHLAISGASDVPFAVSDDSATAAEASIAFKLLGKGPCKILTAGEAMVTAGVRVYAGATGKAALTGTVEVGILLTTAAADGDTIAVADYPPPSAPGISSTSASLVTPDIGAATGTSLVLSGALTAVGGTITTPSLVTPTVKDLTESVTATNVIAASETGSVFFLNSATEFVSTLPAPAAGLKFTFIVKAAPSGASYTIVTNASANIIKGQQQSAAGDAGDTGTTDDTITFVDGQAVPGDRVDVISDGTYWYAYAQSAVAAGVTFTTAS